MRKILKMPFENAVLTVDRANSGSSASAIPAIHARGSTWQAWASVMMALILAPFARAQFCGNGTCESGESRATCARDCWLDTIELLHSDAGRVDWSKDAGDRIAFDMRGPDGFYDVYSIDPDGTDLTCLTCGGTVIPQKHNGQPAWHPTGEWIVFQSESATHDGGSQYATPGRGRYCDLWVLSMKDKNAFQLTTLSPTNLGVLHPHFSNDGRRLSWSQLVAPFKLQTGKEIGSWQLKTADFDIVNGTPVLTNTRTFQPGDSVFYENHGFSPDDSSLIFTSNFRVEQPVLTSNNIYTLNIYTGVLRQLTNDKYNEHATYIPDGSGILWGTNRENQLLNPGMDFWTMNVDGTNKQRVTWFNKSGGFEYIGRARAVDHSWNKAGDKVVAYVQTGEEVDAGDVYILKFHSPSSALKHAAIPGHEGSRPAIFINHSNGSIVVRRSPNTSASFPGATLKIVSMDGKPVAELKGRDEEFSWNTDAVARGVYVLEIDGAATCVKVW